MPVARFRELAARMDALLVARLGDRGVLEDGRELFGPFTSPYIGAAIGGKTGGHRFGQASNADEVMQPTFTVRVVDAEGVVKGAFLTIDLPPEQGGGRYKVVRLQPDGAGMVDLILGMNNERTDDIT
jgi:hypothetical protein